MQKILIAGSLILVAAWFIGKSLSGSLIDNMYQTCSQNTSNKKYCACKQSAMKQLVNPLIYIIDTRNEGYRIVAESSLACNKYLF